MAPTIAPPRSYKSWPAHRWTPLLLLAVGFLLIVQLGAKELVQPVKATASSNSSAPSNSTAPASKQVPKPTNGTLAVKLRDTSLGDAATLLNLAASSDRGPEPSVLCNSRCKCVSLDPTSDANQTSLADLVAFSDELAPDEDAGASGSTTSVAPRQPDRSSPANHNNSLSDVQEGGGQSGARQAQLAGAPLMSTILSSLAPSASSKDDWMHRSNSTSVLKTSPESSLTLFPAGLSHLDALDADKAAGSHESHRLSALGAGKHPATQSSGLSQLHTYLASSYLRRLGLGQPATSPLPTSLQPAAPMRVVGGSLESDFLELKQPIGARLVPLIQLDLSAELRIVRDPPNSYNDAEASSSSSVPVVDTDQLDTSDDSTEERWNDSLQLVDQVSKLMGQLSSRRPRIQSLNLRNNEMQFELWSEIYALLAIPLRHQLLHLDLSHNSLSKLGVTFTGFIERHLAVRQISEWPFASTTIANSSLIVPSTGPGKSSSQARSRTRYSIAHGGKLYNAVMQRHIAYLANGTYSNASGSPTQQQLAASNASIQLASLLQQPMQLRALDLSHNKLKWLINDQFRSIKLIQSIRLDHNRIRYIHQHAFNGLGSLRFLDLSSNKLQVIYVEQFQTNFKLMSLVLRSNYLSYLRGGTFASSAYLKKLDLAENKLTVLSNNAFLALNSLEFLNLSSNQFVNVPSGSLHPLINLRLLDLSANMIAQLAPGTFFHLPVEEIRLNDNNQLVAIERGAFWDLAHLKRLKLSSNPSWMSLNNQAFVGTPNLEHIDIENCTSLDQSARQLVENITMTTTSRQLLRGFQSSNLTVSVPANAVWNHNVSLDSTNLTRRAELAIARQKSLFSQSSDQRDVSTIGSDAQQYVKEVLAAHSSKLKYFYYMGTLTLLAVALKLVYKLSSDQRYLETRRRRHRVYEASSSSPGSSSSRCAPHSPSSFSIGSTSCDDEDYSSHEIDLDQARPRSQSWSSRAARSTGAKQHLRSSLESIPMSIINRQVRSVAPIESFADVIAYSADFQQIQPTMNSDQATELEGDLSVITSGLPTNLNQQMGSCCLGMVDCNQVSPTQTFCSGQGCPINCQHQIQTTSSQQLPTDQMDLVHQQQYFSTGLHYEHANCAHFYQSLGPALHLADYPDYY